MMLILFISLILGCHAGLESAFSSVQTGDATFYGKNSDGGGKCSLNTPQDLRWGELTVALNAPQFAQGGCGMCLQFWSTGKGSGVDYPRHPGGDHCTQSNPCKAFVNNECPECHTGSLDQAVDGDGRWDVSWKAVPCDFNGNLQYVQKSGSSVWFLEVQVRNHRVPVTKFEVNANGRWINLERQPYNYWKCPSCSYPISYPMNVRITDVFGNVVTDVIKEDRPDQVQYGTKQVGGSTPSTPSNPSTPSTPSNPAPSTCSSGCSKCLSSGDQCGPDTAKCCGQGLTCFKKDQYWSSCAASCAPGIHMEEPEQYRTPWSCDVIGSPSGNSGNSGNSGSGSCGAIKEGFDVVGDNLAEKSVGSAQECCDLCKSMPNCQAASLWNNICYPKASSNIVAKSGVSAIVKAATSGNSGNSGNSGSSPCGAIKEGFDVVGADLAQKSVSSAQECCDLCKSMPNCQAASLWNNICYPKASSNTVAKGGVTAIIKSGSSNSASGSCGAIKEGFDVVGDNLAEKSVGSAQECCDLCKSMPNCQAASLWNNICYPKASSNIVAKGGVTAIVKSGSGNVVNSGSGNSASASGDVYCPTANDMNLDYGSVTFKNGGWEMLGSARVSSKTAWNLLGGYMEWDMDLSKVADEVNTNFYTSSPPRPNCGSNCYCDIQAGSFVSCMELDFMENNGKCIGNTALHMFPTDGRSGNTNCDRWGCNSLTAKYGNPNVHYRAEVGNDGYVKVFVNGVLNANYGPQPSSDANNVVVKTMQTIGAVIESSQWFGWVPGDTLCPRGNSNGLGGSFVRVYNVKVKGKVVQGPIPNKC